MGAFNESWSVVKQSLLNTDKGWIAPDGSKWNNLMTPMKCPLCKGPMQFQDGYMSSRGRFIEPAYMCMDPQEPYCEVKRHDVKSSLEPPTIG